MAVSKISRQMDTSFQFSFPNISWDTIDGAKAIFDALPLIFHGICGAGFSGGYHCTALITKAHTYASILLLGDANVPPRYYTNNNGNWTRYVVSISQ